MYTICDETPWSRHDSYVEDESQARALVDARTRGRRGSWRVELRLGESVLRAAGPTGRAAMDDLRRRVQRAMALAYPVRYSGRGRVHYALDGEDVRRTVEDCPCVLPEQSCPACRQAAARACRLSWDDE